VAIRPTEIGFVPSKLGILMPVSMLVRCEKCGYENFPQHRFCGMCAAELRLPEPGGTQPASTPKRVSPPPPFPPKQAVAPVKREVPADPLSGPSFLGLGNERAETKSVSYLLEDDEPSHIGRNLILILLLVAVAAAGWYWRQELRVAAGKFLSPSAASKAASGGDNPDGSSSAPAPATSESGAAPAAANPALANSQPNAQAAAAQLPLVAAPPVTGAADSAQSPSSSPSGDSDSPTAAAKTGISPDTTRQPAVAPRKMRVQTPPATSGDDLAADGEKYLYGNGVPENCALARKNLLAAAQRSNAQAENVLGTMYATGHCATRDLPTAYRWFARSLHKDPNNTRIEQDLKVLWAQMTPEEQRLALRDER
jgi:hypothetical protein